MREVTLALSGGAARGAYHLGVLECIDEQGIKVKAICGTSIGAIIGASYSSGVAPRKQLEIFKSKEFRDIFSFNFFRKSIFEIDANADILHELIPSREFDKLNIPLFVTAVDLDNGVEICYDSGDIVKICLASSALIPLFKPIEYDGLLLGDGGILNHIPTAPLKDFDYPTIGVNLHPFTRAKSSLGIYGLIKRMVYLNAFSHSGDMHSDCELMITNDRLRDYSLVSFNHLDEMFELGYNDAKRLLKEQ